MRRVHKEESSSVVGVASLPPNGLTNSNGNLSLLMSTSSNDLAGASMTGSLIATSNAPPPSVMTTSMINTSNIEPSETRQFF